MAGSLYQRKEMVLLVMHFDQCVSINCHSQCSHRQAAALIILLIVVKTRYVFLLGRKIGVKTFHFLTLCSVILFIYHVIIRVGEQLSAEAEASWSAC